MLPKTVMEKEDADSAAQGTLFLYKHDVFWVSLRMVIVFLISSLCFVHNILKIIEFVSYI